MGEALISSKGQVVIPQEFRKRYQLNPKSRALWVDMGGVLLLVPRRRDPVGESRGILKGSRFSQKALKLERKREKARVYHIG